MRYRITKNSRCLDEKNRLSRNNPILLDDDIKKGHQPAMMLRRVLDWTFTFCNQEDSKRVLLKRFSHVNTSRAGLHAVASFLVVILAGWQLNTCQLCFIEKKHDWAVTQSDQDWLKLENDHLRVIIVCETISPDLWKFVCCSIISVKAAVKVTLNTCHYSLVTSLSNATGHHWCSLVQNSEHQWWVGGCLVAALLQAGPWLAAPRILEGCPAFHLLRRPPALPTTPA